jgi:hypothetical protein
MRFYETDEAFVLLNEGEEAPLIYPTYNLQILYGTHEQLFLPTFNLLLKYWTSYEYPTQINSSFNYCGFIFRIKHDYLNEAELFSFLNDLKAGDFDSKIKKYIIESYKTFGKFSIDNTLKNIEEIQQENESLKRQISNIKEIVCERKLEN